MRMEEEGIGVVLARAAELRLKISSCIHKATAFTSQQEESLDGSRLERKEEDGEANEAEEVEGVGAEAERLSSICDAFEALESQLSSLQVISSNPSFLFFTSFYHGSEVVSVWF